MEVQNTNYMRKWNKQATKGNN